MAEDNKKKSLQERISENIRVAGFVTAFYTILTIPSFIGMCLEPKEEIRTAFPAVVVAAPGTQAVWSVIFTVASLSKSIVVSVSSRETVTFQPVELSVFTLKVLVAKTAVPGVSVGN